MKYVFLVLLAGQPAFATDVNPPLSGRYKILAWKNGVFVDPTQVTFTRTGHQFFYPKENAAYPVSLITPPIFNGDASTSIGVHWYKDSKGANLLYFVYLETGSGSGSGQSSPGDPPPVNTSTIALHHGQPMELTREEHGSLFFKVRATRTDNLLVELRPDPTGFPH